MAVTKTDMANKALRKMGVLPQGQQATNAQSTDLKAAYDEVYDRLAEDDLVTWGSGQNVPDRFVQPVVALMAANRVNEWSVPQAKMQAIISEANNAMTLIRRLVAEPYYYVPTRFTDY